MNAVEASLNNPPILLNRVLGGILHPSDQFYRPILDHLLTYWGLISFVGTLTAISLIVLGCVFWLLDLKKIEGHQLVLAGLLIFLMIQCLMANLHQIFFLG